jgi:glycosyltransferase involved in cell wall biosynthesis
VEDETRLLRDAGHDVSVWAPEPEDIHGLGLVRTAARVVWSREAARVMRRLIAEQRPEIVHCHNMYPAISPVVLRVASSAGVPVVVTLHSYRLMCLPATFVRQGRSCQDCLGRLPWPGVVHRCYRDSLAGSAAIATSLAVHRWIGSFARPRLYLAVSEFLKHKYVEAGWSTSDIKVKGNFAWPTPRREGPGKYFLYLGRLAPEKGLDTLFQVWRDVGAPLLIVGDGPMAAQLREQVPSGVELVGSVPPSRVPDLLREARALLFPSRSFEGQPRGILEAYAAGVPVIASRFGSLPEVVRDGVSGRLVPPNDDHAWRDAVGSLLSDQESERLGEGAWSLWSTSFRPEQALLNLEAVYRTLVSS